MKDDKMHFLIFFAFKHSHDAAFNGFLGQTHVQCHDPSLGLAIKARAWKGVGRECNPRVTLF
jgi:hypothetical protein